MRRCEELVVHTGDESKDGDIFGDISCMVVSSDLLGTCFYNNEEEIQRINRLAHQVDTSQIFVVEKNLNPKGYGEGRYTL